MITKNGSIINSKANLIIKIVGTECGTKEFVDIPHVEKEHIKYVRHCQKNNINAIGAYQCIPTQVWAMVMVDTIKSNNIVEYDKDYQYIVLVYGKNNFNDSLNVNAIKKALTNIRNKAEALKASVAIKWDNEVANIVKDVFNNYADADIEIWK